MSRCRRCGEAVEGSFRYCPWCSAPLRLKLTELFRGSDRAGEDGKGLRVSRYFGVEGRKPEVRFSVWSDTRRGEMRADAAVSLDESEASRLARFLAEAPVEDEATIS